MTRRVRLRSLAAADLEQASRYYLSEAGQQQAIRFVDAAERTLSRIRRNPLTGSLHFAYELDIPELRAMSIASFPYHVFYVTTDHEVDVWRILHSRRDLAAAITPPSRDDQ